MTNPLPQNIDPELLVRFLSEACDAEEREYVSQWLNADELNRQYFEELSVLWNASAGAGDFQATWLREDWDKVHQRIKTTGAKDVRKDGRHRSLITLLVRVAAVVTVLIGIYFLLHVSYKSLSSHDSIVSSGDTVKTVSLPDGSVVTLNVGSKLIYPDKFDADTRAVSLEGEAFFEVTESSNLLLLRQVRHKLSCGYFL